MKRIVLCGLLSVLSVVSLLAQVTVKASLDSAEIFIGEQAHIDLKVVSPAGTNAIFPVFPSKQLVPGIEVLNEEIISKEDLNDGRQQAVIKRYTITSFDSSFYFLPPLKVRVGNKQYSSESLALKVLTLEVDTLHLDQFFPPRPIAEMPFSWQDMKGLFGMSLLLVFMLSFMAYVVIQLHNNRPLLKYLRKAVLPPHVWAMKKIEKLKATHTAMTDTKDYYSALTDVIRHYIEQRYGFNALEMTSQEIISRLNAFPDATSLQELKELFYTADLAKFAKLQTQLNENDANLLRAVGFINATKQEKSEEKKSELPPEIKRTDRERLVLKVVVGIVCVLSAGLLFEIVRSLYQMLY